METDSKMIAPPSVADIRKATLGVGAQFKRATVKVADGIEVEVRQPNVRQRGAILRAAKALSGDVEKLDLSELQVQAVINCTYRPFSGELVYSDADHDGLMEREPGGFVDEIAEVALKFLNVDSEDAAKN